MIPSLRNQSWLRIWYKGNNQLVNDDDLIIMKRYCYVSILKVLHCYSTSCVQVVIGAKNRRNTLRLIMMHFINQSYIGAVKVRL